MESDAVDDADLAAAAAATERSIPPNAPISSRAQPTWSRPYSGASATKPRIQQPTPQHLPHRSGPSAVLVSPRQKGNPILTHIRSVPWEYSDIPADYLLGATTCALFLSLKYHRLHPEYIYSRIRALKHKYLLRVLLVMVDIDNHEAPLNELAKTSLINDFTLMLCWSAAEAGRYLELYKSMEHTTPASIKNHAATSYAESLVEFVTTPRSVNKTDAIALVSAFGSVRAAVNARPEEIGLIAGWGEKKVQRWTSTVREKFRVRKAARNRLGERSPERDAGVDGDGAGVAARLGIGPEQPQEILGAESGVAPVVRGSEDVTMWEPGEDEEEALIDVVNAEESLHSGKRPLERGGERSKQTDPTNATGRDEEPSAGVMAALAKLREKTR
ncbi:hypothetical protein GP486_006447 [Trichoglossum hirsutum]|uniref:ERCC1-like central domain-containing protein n=1 Tax=Trichoglossum hirsutum TaxID=265104 RepID=A0A9P8IDJ1_9PEZI|nr:hypothetical protein GP486_006447 [Trichoglossum hirsutum]